MDRRVMTASLACAVAALAGCRGERSDNPPRQFFPDMDDQPRLRPQYETEFFADGRSQRLPVEGTIAYARWDGNVNCEHFQESEWSGPIIEERARLLKADRELYYGSVGGDPAEASSWLMDIPVGVDRDLILEGQGKFDTYCAPCHGYEGDGLGMVGQRWSYPVPSYHDDKYQRAAGASEKTGRDGYLFHVIRSGVPNDTKPGYFKMPPYGHALDEQEAWSVVAYIRTIQAARRGSESDLSSQERQRLNEMRGVPAAESRETESTGGDL